MATENNTKNKAKTPKTENAGLGDSGEQDSLNKDKENLYEDRPLKGLLLTTSVGIAMVVSILIGLIIGIYLDKYFESRPWFTITFIILGVIAGFKNLHRTMKEHGF